MGPAIQHRDSCIPHPYYLDLNYPNKLSYPYSKTMNLVHSNQFNLIHSLACFDSFYDWILTLRPYSWESID